jgi:hypothetical protein
MNDSKNSSNGLLVLRFPQFLSQAETDQIIRAVTPTAKLLGVEPMVLGNGADASVSVDYTSLLMRLCVAVERLVAQGEPPAAPEELERPVLNARPSGLNTRG